MYRFEYGKQGIVFIPRGEYRGVIKDMFTIRSLSFCPSMDEVILDVIPEIPKDIAKMITSFLVPSVIKFDLYGSECFDNAPIIRTNSATCIKNFMLRSYYFSYFFLFQREGKTDFAWSSIIENADPAIMVTNFELKRSRDRVMTKRQNSRYLKSIKNFDIRKRRQVRLENKALKENRE